jgi:hypothetical protein
MAIETSTGSRPRSPWASVVIPGFFLIAVAIIGGRYVGSGLATHGDSRSVIEGSVPAILQGSYFRSRSYGNPLYEYAAALIYPAGGVLLTSLYSLVLALASIVVFNRLLGPRVVGAVRLFALAALCFNPLFLINAFAVSEWSQVVLILLLLLWSAREWLVTARPASLAGVGLFSALLVLTRPDSALVCAGVCAALLWQIRFERNRSLALLGALALAAVVTVSIFALLNHGLAFVKTGINFATAPYWRRAIVASVGIYSTFGPIAPLIVVVVAIGVLRRLPTMPSTTDSFWARLFILTVPIVLIRFVTLPDKLEYILYLLVLATLLLAYECPRPLWLALYAVSSALSSVVTLSLFERVGITDHISLHARFGPGAVAQDARGIQYNWQLMRDPSLRSRISAVVYGGSGDARPQLRTENWAAGLLSDTGDLIVGEPEAYHLDNPRDEAKYQRHLYTDIYLCNRSVWINGSYGWRLAEPAVAWPTFDDREGQLNLRCHKE